MRHERTTNVIYTAEVIPSTGEGAKSVNRFHLGSHNTQATSHRALRGGCS